MLGFAPTSSLPLSTLPTVLSLGSISGYTKYKCGPVLSGCTVKLYRASDDFLVDSTVSDINGYYEFVNPVGFPFYAVAYNPDGTLGGITRINLAPA
jgi:hypothetical protein